MCMSHFFRSLRFRLLLIVVLALLPAFGLVIYNASEQRQTVYDRMQEDTLDIAQRLANHQNELVEGAHQLLFVLAQLPVIRGEDAQACTAYLADLKQKNTSYMNILKWDSEGNLLCDASNSPLPHKMPTIQYLYKVLETGDFTILNFVISPHTGERALSFGYPILDDQGQTQAVLFAALHLHSINEVLFETELPDGSTLTLRDRNGTVLAHYPDPEAWIGQPDPDIQASPALGQLHGEGTLETEGADGVKRLYAYTPVYSSVPSELYLIVGIPSEIALATVNETLSDGLIILVLAGLLALVAIWLGGDIFLLRPIQGLLRVTRRMAGGDLSARAEVRHEASELSELAFSFDQMAETLEKRELERRLTSEALAREEAARARLLHQIITANEDEHRRMARELHDETSQNLTALILGLDTAEIAMQKDPLRAYEHFKRVKSIAQELLEGIHRIVNNLRPAMLDDLGLVPAISLCADKQLKPAGIDLDLQADQQYSRLPLFIETALFRVVQEAFTNVIRHSHAKNVTVRLTQTDQALNLVIIDDGQGFDTAALASGQPRDGFGLHSMQERVRMLDGHFKLESMNGSGTQIVICIPLPKDKGEHVQNSCIDCG